MPNKLINSLLSRRKSLFGKLRTSAPNHQLEANQYALPDWQSFLAHSTLWRQALTGAVKGKRVLIPTSIGGLSAATILEGMLGVAMTLRGAQVRFLLCDGVLPACLQVHAGKLKQTSVITDYKLKSQVCPGCIARGDAAYKATGYLYLITATSLTKLRGRICAM